MIFVQNMAAGAVGHDADHSKPTNTSNSCLKRESKKPTTFALWQMSTPKKRPSNPDNYRQTAKSKAKIPSLKCPVEERSERLPSAV
jgi:hypothetical protein